MNSLLKSPLLYRLSCALLLFLLSACGRIDRDASVGASAITPDVIARHIQYLASDALKGRNTPSPELDTAAAYIAREFASLGIEPPDGSYFQRVGLNVVALGPVNSLRITAGDGERIYSLKDDFVPFDMTANREASGGIVFVGYGITAPEYNFDEYSGIDVHNKIVFLLRHEPGEEDSASVFMGKKETRHAQMEKKVSNAIEHGAAAVLVATDPLNHRLLTPRGFPWPSLSTIIPADALPTTLAIDEAKKVPVVHVGPGIITQLFGSVEALRAIQQQIDSTLKPQSRPLAATCAVRTSTVITDRSARNVVGLLRGQNTADSEAVVIGAHYDHVGMKKATQPGEDVIFNGADDNASGTSGVLSIARAFSAMPGRPRRSVLFILFAGEEKGLLGSLAYTRAPLIPLKQTVAMINLDMIGRNSPDSVSIGGEGWSPDLVRVAIEENKAFGFMFGGQANASFGGSDHATFLRNGVPAIFFHAGQHADYHKVTDEPAKIDTRKAARVSELAFRTAWRVANDTTHYTARSTPITLF